MGKCKKGISDKVRKAKSANAKNVFKVQNNPFEVKINKQKYKILGRKTKHDRGLPGVSRSTANKKRKDTLLKEYKERYKKNSVVDERFGEESSEISVEEKMLQRFAMEKKKKHEKMFMFNLNDEEELTHFGQSLADIDDFGANAESDEEDTGVISGEYVSEAHFGGGIFTKKAESDSQPDAEKPKSRKEIIDEIILKSKKAKFEKQTAQEEANDLREKLDNTWQEVEMLLKSSSRTPKDKETAKETYKPDAYDVAVKQMQFDKKAAPSTRGKTEAEKAAEEAARIRKLEEMRIARMHEDYDHVTQKSAHRSADDLNYEFLPEKIYVNPVEYKDGVMVGSEDVVQTEDADDWQLDPVISVGSENEADDDDGHNNGESDEEDASDQEEDDDFSDIVSDDDDDQVDGGSSDDHCEEDSGVTSLDIDSVVTSAKRQDKFPESLAEFCLIAQSKYKDNCEKYIMLLQKRFPPHSAKGNKEKMQKLFQYVWCHLCNSFSKDNPQIGEMDKIVKHLYGLCQINPVPCAKFVIKELRTAHKKHLLKSGRLTMPEFSYLMQFKLIKILFSTSDFFHPVCAPAMIFMTHILHSCRPTNLKDLSTCLFLCTLVYEYVCFSKRFVPECLNFLCAAVCFSIPKPVQKMKGVPSNASLYLSAKNCELLAVTDVEESEVSSQKPDLLKLLKSKSEDAIGDDGIVRFQLLRTALKLVLKFVILYGQIPCFKEIFDPIRISCARSLTGYRNESGGPHPHAELLSEIQNEIQRLLKRGPALAPLVQTESNKPKFLPLYDPKIEEVGEPFQKGSRKSVSSTKRERERLQHKYKRELKGAVREIKKDARFIAREQLNEQIEKDKERAAKVKRLFGFLSNQEGEVKKINRKKFKLDLS